nr:MAG TPA: hypothetical protein [Caudoviricetes sp.]
MLLCDVTTQLLQIFLPVNYQPRIIQRLVVTNIQLGPEILYVLYFVKLFLNPFPFFFMLSGIYLNLQARSPP